ncbi:MAG: putative addiction module antidote protein [Betaproteobacteria bacterium]|nr:putative addiction module antidote protein [Betaproteobacteria bacterium]MDE2046831.1 putative addiction module antidote protein [Betaproteobacteria bacterium]
MKAETHLKAQRAAASVSHDEALKARLAKNTKLAAAYVQAALQDGDQAAYLLALRRVAEARGGMAQVAKAAGVSRESLYRTLSKGGNPRLTTLTAVLQASGLALSVHAKPGVTRAKSR